MYLIDCKPIQQAYSVLGFWNDAFDHHLTFPFVKRKGTYFFLSKG